MKIVCDSCATKYSIADDKVRGRVFKIRCKKCGHIIVVRGGDGAAAQPVEGTVPQPGQPPLSDDRLTPTPVAVAQVGDDETALGAVGPEAVWYVVIDRKQVGPMGPDEVQARLAAGQIDAETYVWRDGFDDWLHLSAVDELQELVGATGQLPDGGGAMAAAGAPLDGRSPAVRHDPSAGDGDVAALAFEPTGPAASPVASGVGQLLAAAASAGEHEEEVAGMFAGLGTDRLDTDAPPVASAPGRADDDLFRVTPAPVRVSSASAAAASTQTPLRLVSSRAVDVRPAGEPAGDDEETPMLTAQRHDNSVLFSLANLQALSGGGGGGKATAEAHPAVASLAMGDGKPADGSGLIDIRAMAKATLVQPVAAGREDDLPALGSGAFAAAPVLMPVQPTSALPRWVWPVVGSASLLLVAAVAGLSYMLLVRPPAPAAVSPRTRVASPPSGATPAKFLVAAAGQPASSAGSSASASAGAAAAGSAAGEGAGVPVPSSGGAAAGAATDGIPGGAAPGKGEAVSGPRSKRAERERGRKVAERGPRAAPGPSPAPPAPYVPPPSRAAGHASAATPARGRGSDLDGLLADAVRGSAPPSAHPAPRATSPAESEGDLPDKLERDQIQTGMARARGRVRGCYEQYRVPGTVMVKLTIAGSGSVASASVEGRFAGTPTGDCVAQAVRAARFPKFRGPSISVSYPFTLTP